MTTWAWREDEHHQPTGAGPADAGEAIEAETAVEAMTECLRRMAASPGFQPDKPGKPDSVMWMRPRVWSPRCGSAMSMAVGLDNRGRLRWPGDDVKLNGWPVGAQSRNARKAFEAAAG